MTHRSRLVPGLAALVLSLGCAGSSGPVAFPPGLTPLEEDTAPVPAADGADAHPEVVTTVVGTGDGFEYAHARGFIHAPVLQVANALKLPAVCVDRRQVDAFTVATNVEEGYDVSFRIHNVVHQLVTVEFDTTWRQGVVEGTAAVPTMVAGRAAKTEGTGYITLLEDSVVLRTVDESTTAVELVRHIKSATAGSPEAEQYLKDLYASIRAQSHGEALPKY